MTGSQEVLKCIVYEPIGVSIVFPLLEVNLVGNSGALNMCVVAVANVLIDIKAYEPIKSELISALLPIVEVQVHPCLQKFAGPRAGPERNRP